MNFSIVLYDYTQYPSENTGRDKMYLNEFIVRTYYHVSIARAYTYRHDLNTHILLCILASHFKENI